MSVYAFSVTKLLTSTLVNLEATPPIEDGVDEIADDVGFACVWNNHESIPVDNKACFMELLASYNQLCIDLDQIHQLWRIRRSLLLGISR